MAIVSGPGGGINPPGSGQEYTDATTLQKVREHIFRGAVRLKRVLGVASALVLEAADDALAVSIRGPRSLPNGSYGLTMPEDVGTADQRLAIDSISSREIVLGWADGAGVAGTAFPTTKLYTGRRFFHTTYNEWFTYHGGSGLPLGTAVWLGELQTLHFGTTATTGTGAQALFTNGNVLTVTDDRGAATLLDIMTMYVSMKNGSGSNLTGTLTIRNGSSTLCSQSWSSEQYKANTVFARATAGDILSGEFNITSGTIERPVVILGYRHVITA